LSQSVEQPRSDQHPTSGDTAPSGGTAFHDIISAMATEPIPVVAAQSVIRPPTLEPAVQTAPDDPNYVEPEQQRRPLPLRILRVVGWIALGWIGMVVLQLLVVGAALGLSAWQLSRAEARLTTNPEAAIAALPRVQAGTRVAHLATQGPFYASATHLPLLGGDFQALRTVTETVDGLTAGVFPRITAAVLAVDPAHLSFADGRFDPQPLLTAREEVHAADAVVHESIDQLRQVDLPSLVAPLRFGTRVLVDQLEEVGRLTTTAARAVDLLPAMLGIDGPREWLVLAQTNAEPRALGGLVGQMFTFTADDGRIALGQTISGPAFDVLRQQPLVLDRTGDEVALFGDWFDGYLQNLTWTPDFPRAAEWARAMWQVVGGTEPDGVIAIDPVALQAMIEVTGGIEFVDPFGETVELTSNNASEFLHVGIYQRYPEPAVQDEVFSLAAAAVLSRLLGGGFSPLEMVAALDWAATQGRLMVWSAHPEEQAELYNTVLGGTLRGAVPLPDGQTAPEVGVFVNQTSSGKLGFYLDWTAAASNVQATADGGQRFTVTVTVHSSLTPELATGLPEYVVSDSGTTGIVDLRIYLFAPLGGQVEPDDVGGQVAVFDGFQVATQDIAIGPGETAVLTYQVWSGPAQSGPVEFRITPAAR